MALKHTYENPIDDAPDVDGSRPDFVKPSDWNDDHAYTGVSPELKEAGAVTLAGKTGAVSFTTAEADISYFVTLAGNADENFYWTNKTVNGFTINSSWSGSTATIDWSIMRLP